MEIFNYIFGISTALAQNVNAGEIASETEGQLTQLVGYIIGQIPLWITAFIVLIITFVMARIAKSAVENKMAAEGFEEENKEVAILASRSANAGVLIVGITIALKIAGIDLTAIIAAGAFGVGFALQDIIMNFIAGVMILSSRHYSIGDSIKVGGIVGKIVEIQTRATILRAFDGTKIIVPNADLFKNKVVSLTSNPFRRIKLEMGVNYGEDLRKTMEVVMKAVESTEGVLAQPKPAMRYTGFGQYSVNFGVKAWVESRGGWIKIRHRMLLNINKALHEAGISIPYPIQTLHVSQEEVEEEKIVMESGGESTPESSQQQLEPAPVIVEPPAPPKPISTEDVNAQTWLKKSEPQPEPQPEPAPVEQPQQVPSPEIPPQPEQKPIAGITPVQPAAAPEQPQQNPEESQQ
ncbi:mechanosensitive ion channel [Candidatus Peregrinibacteria bacterium]|nr:mechanosensitive ion channel [Candidatus Peregrinibacteria bacterium]